MTSEVAAALPPVTAEVTAVEPLQPARALQQGPAQPANPLHHHLPPDASGMAVTRRGPLAPALHRLLSSPHGHCSFLLHILLGSNGCSRCLR